MVGADPAKGNFLVGGYAVIHEVIIIEPQIIRMIRFDLNPKGSGLSLVSMLGFECVGTSRTLDKVTINVVTKVVNVYDTSPESRMREDAGGLRHKPRLSRD